MMCCSDIVASRAARWTICASFARREHSQHKKLDRNSYNIIGLFELIIVIDTYVCTNITTIQVQQLQLKIVFSCPSFATAYN